MAIIYSGNSPQVKDIATAVSEGIEAKGGNTKLIQVQGGRTSRSSMRTYDLVVIGSSITSFFGGKISERLENYIKYCTGLEGKRTAAFVPPKLFGADKALKQLMSLLESKGAIVVDFRRLNSVAEAREFGKKLD